ncbi:hypothetical protein DK59_3082 [Brucella abortus bv. 4 str. 292]|nr:hypothetical protein DK59_3082 [Brucella abortus bv. 4 str. 292]
MGTDQARVSSPPWIFSIFQTSAPMSARLIVAQGPASTRDRSRTFVPASGKAALLSGEPVAFISFIIFKFVSFSIGRPFKIGETKSGCCPPFLREVARHLMAASPVLQFGPHFGADCLCPETTGAERTAGRRIDRAWHVAFQQYLLPLALDDRIGERHCRHQGLRVGMQRMPIKPGFGGLFHDAAKIHDGNGVRDMAHNRQVMGNENIRCPEPLLNILKEIQDTGLNGNIERRDGLIQHHDLRIEGQGTRNHYALTLPAGKLMRIAFAVLRVEPHQTQHFLHALLALCLREIADA